MRVRRGLLVLCLVCLPSDALADSDGYFCSAPGYLAFDTFIPARPGRIINIVRFDPVTGIRAPEQIEIVDDIQTHGISCKPSSIEIYSWDHRYVIDTSTPLAPKLTTKQPSTFGRGTSAENQRNLGRWARHPDIVVIQSVNAREWFELVISQASRQESRNSRVIYTSTELVHRVDLDIRDRQPLYFGIFRETVD